MTRTAHIHKKKGQCELNQNSMGPHALLTPSKNSYNLTTFDWTTIEIEYKMSLSTG